eukprot:scaffold144598_cov19-Tisochrysis_lutea.AAC.1
MGLLVQYRASMPGHRAFHTDTKAGKNKCSAPTVSGSSLQHLMCTPDTAGITCSGSFSRTFAPRNMPDMLLCTSDTLTLMPSSVLLTLG